MMFMSVGVGAGRAEPLVGERPSLVMVARPRPIASRARRGTAVRVAFGVVAGSLGFLVAYTTLQLLHAGRADPAAVAALATIPLFARFSASALCGLAFATLAQLVRPVAAGALLRRLPAFLAAAIVLFAAIVVLFP
jgi:hypothetical protein